VSQKVVVHQTHDDNFVNSYVIFKILSQLERAVNLQQNPYNSYHDTRDVNTRVLGIYIKNAKLENPGLSTNRV